jgi:hypothetical protein
LEPTRFSVPRPCFTKPPGPEILPAATTLYPLVSIVPPPTPANTIGRLDDMGPKACNVPPEKVSVSFATPRLESENIASVP